jgi:hypothetical protein
MVLFSKKIPSIILNLQQILLTYLARKMDLVIKIGDRLVLEVLAMKFGEN